MFFVKEPAVINLHSHPRANRKAARKREKDKGIEGGGSVVNTIAGSAARSH